MCGSWVKLCKKEWGRMLAYDGERWIINSFSCNSALQNYFKLVKYELFNSFFILISGWSIKHGKFANLLFVNLTKKCTMVLWPVSVKVPNCGDGSYCCFFFLDFYNMMYIVYFLWNLKFAFYFILVSLTCLNFLIYFWCFLYMQVDICVFVFDIMFANGQQ